MKKAAAKRVVRRKKPAATRVVARCGTVGCKSRLRARQLPKSSADMQDLCDGAAQCRALRGTRPWTSPEINARLGDPEVWTCPRCTEQRKHQREVARWQALALGDYGYDRRELTRMIEANRAFEARQAGDGA